MCRDIVALYSCGPYGQVIIVYCMSTLASMCIQSYNYGCRVYVDYSYSSCGQPEYYFGHPTFNGVRLKS